MTCIVKKQNNLIFSSLVAYTCQMCFTSTAGYGMIIQVPLFNLYILLCDYKTVRLYVLFINFCCTFISFCAIIQFRIKRKYYSNSLLISNIKNIPFSDKVNKRVTSYEFQVQIYELRVQIHELRVQIYELGFQIHELRVQILELRVQIHKSQVQIYEMRFEFKSTNYEFKFMSYEFKFTSYWFKSTSQNTKSTSWKIKNTSQELKSTSRSSKTTSQVVNIRVRRKNSQFKNIKLHELQKGLFSLCSQC